MKNDKAKKNALAKEVLSAGEKFWKEYLDTPYSSDKVGQAFVRSFRGQALVKKGSQSPAEKSRKEGQQSHDTSTQDPGLKFLEELDRIPHTYDRVGQVSVSSWKGRPFRNTTSKRKLEDLDSNNDQSTNH